MAHHILTLDYQEAPTPKFTASPDPLDVKQGDTIAFKLAKQGNRSFKVTMDEKFFKPREINDSTTPTTVIAALKDNTMYQCELFDSAGKSLFQSSNKQPGGGMRPGH